MDVNSIHLFKARVDKFWSCQDVLFDWMADLARIGNKMQCKNHRKKKSGRCLKNIITYLYVHIHYIHPATTCTYTCCILQLRDSLGMIASSQLISKDVLQQSLFYQPGLSLPIHCMLKAPTTSTAYQLILPVRQPSFSDKSQKAPAAATQQFPTISPADMSADISADIPHITVTISETQTANM